MGWQGHARLQMFFSVMLLDIIFLNKVHVQQEELGLALLSLSDTEYLVLCK